MCTGNKCVNQKNRVECAASSSRSIQPHKTLARSVLLDALILWVIVAVCVPLFTSIRSVCVCVCVGRYVYVQTVNSERSVVNGLTFSVHRFGRKTAAFATLLTILHRTHTTLCVHVHSTACGMILFSQTRPVRTDAPSHYYTT